jgi:hypothetical protein
MYAMRAFVLSMHAAIPRAALLFFFFLPVNANVRGVLL